MAVAGAVRERKEKLLFIKSFSFARNEEFWRWAMVMVAQQCKCT